MSRRVQVGSAQSRPWWNGEGRQGASRMGRSEQGNTSLSLVMITSDGPEHHYVTNRILDEFELDAIIVDRGRPQGRADRIRSLLDRYTTRQLISRLLLRVTSVLLRDDARRHRDLLDVFGDEARVFARPDLVRSVDGINTDAGRSAVSDTSPDMLLIYGTGIVGRQVLAMANETALNLHTGMSPEYRGADCAFWPIHNREFDLVGATVHECTPRVDGGEIYAREGAHLRPGDGQFTAFARCVEVGAELYIDTIRRALGHRLTGEKQDPDAGREYRAADKRLRHDLYVRWLFRTGRVHQPVHSVATSRGIE
jgi:methionyl-tRNA formyltransferase